MLEQMVACGEEFERRVNAGERYPFANAVTAMRELHRGTHRPYPCGAGAGYLGVAADGELAACHRFVGDPAAGFGSVTAGIDRAASCAGWMSGTSTVRNHDAVLGALPLRRRLPPRGDRPRPPACDYIRGWLHWSIGAYARLSAARPDYFDGP